MRCAPLANRTDPTLDLTRDDVVVNGICWKGFVPVFVACVKPVKILLTANSVSEVMGSFCGDLNYVHQ